MKLTNLLCRKYSMTKVWDKLRDELSLSNSTELELRVCKWASLIWPGLQRLGSCAALASLDKDGIDLVDGGGGASKLAVVIQCKGRLPPKPIAKEDIRAAEKSVTSFINSPYSCETYAFIHNSASGSADLYRELAQVVSRVSASGKAEQAFCWNIANFSNHLKQQLVLSINRIDAIRQRRGGSS